MIPVNRDTLMMIATIICAAGIIFLFKELNKTKDELNSFKDFSVQVVKQLKPPTPEPVSEPEKKEETKEEKSNE
jgi:uncharacterized membrane protein